MRPAIARTTKILRVSDRIGVPSLSESRLVQGAANQFFVATLPAPWLANFRRTSLAVLNPEIRLAVFSVVIVIRISEMRQTVHIVAPILRLSGLPVTQTLPKMTLVPIPQYLGACS